MAQYTWPAFTVLWSALLLREPLTSRMLVSCLLRVVAVAVGAHGPQTPGGAWSQLTLALIVAVVFGLYSTLLKRIEYEPFSSMAVGFTVATFLSLQSAPHRFVAPWVALTPLLAAACARNSIELEPRHWMGVALVLVSVLLATLTSTRATSEPLPQLPRRFDLAEESS